MKTADIDGQQDRLKKSGDFFPFKFCQSVSMRRKVSVKQLRSRLLLLGHTERAHSLSSVLVTAFTYISM